MEMRKRFLISNIFLIFIIIVFVFSIILWVKPWTQGLQIFNFDFADLNQIANYQLVTLLITFGFLLGYFLLKKEVFLQYFRFGNLGAKPIPEKYVGILPNKDETWKDLGTTFAVIITLVTAVVMYFLSLQNQNWQASDLIKFLPFILVFSLINSFVEEMVFRLGVVVALKDLISDRKVAIVSGMIFGLVHYFGTPGGWIGVLVAGFLGWFLAKSILETKGIFWAWLIHFLQDMVIFATLFLIL